MFYDMENTVEKSNFPQGMNKQPLKVLQSKFSFHNSEKLWEGAPPCKPKGLTNQNTPKLNLINSISLIDEALPLCLFAEIHVTTQINSLKFIFSQKKSTGVQ